MKTRALQVSVIMPCLNLISSRHCGYYMKISKWTSNKACMHAFMKLQRATSSEHMPAVWALILSSTAA